MTFGVWARYAMGRKGCLAAGVKRGETPATNGVPVFWGSLNDWRA